MRSRELVLGSGPSALAHLFYNPDAFALAGPDVGGLFAKQVMGPQYVWVTRSTEKLMSDLGLTPRIRKVRVGYCLDGKLHAAEELTKETMARVRSMYSLKTRGTEPQPSHMSSGNGTFEVYSLGVSTLVEVLHGRVEGRLIRDTAHSIRLYDQRVDGDDVVYEYDRLISTIPAPRLLAMAGLPKMAERLLAFDKAYEMLSPGTGLVGEFDYAYYPEHEPHHRVSVVGGDSGGARAVFEYTVKPGARAPDGAQLHRGGQIVGGHEVLESLPRSVELLGRYAEWRHDRRLEDVLEAIQ